MYCLCSCKRKNCNTKCERLSEHKGHHFCEKHMWQEYFRKKENRKKRKLRKQTKKIDPYDLDVYNTPQAKAASRDLFISLPEEFGEAALKAELDKQGLTVTTRNLGTVFIAKMNACFLHLPISVRISREMYDAIKQRTDKDGFCDLKISLAD